MKKLNILHEIKLWQNIRWNGKKNPTIFSSFFISLVMSIDFLCTFLIAKTRPL